jgi:hypothetical protein
MNISDNGRPRSCSTMRRTDAKDSAGTWSLQSLNSETSSAGKTPSPEERICPSFMKVGPRSSNANRSRRERPERDLSGPLGRSINHQAPMDMPSLVPTLSTRPAGGIRLLLKSSGT